MPFLRFIVAIHTFLVHSFFGKNKKSFLWLTFGTVIKIISYTPRYGVLQKELFFLKKNLEILLSTKLITLKSFIQQNKLIDKVPGHCFDATSSDFQQIVNSE